MMTPDDKDLRRLRAVAATFRRWIVEQSFRSGVGHIGSALSIVEIIAALWGAVMKDPGSDRADRDRFVLGKGHAALALYCALRWRGVLDEAAFTTYCADGSLLGAHPEHELPGVEVSTGSLGQALSIGCGLALGLRHRGLASRVFALLSDAECNEGQVWEAAQFAAHHRLGGLTAVVDCNGLQALGRTRDILDLSPLADRWRAFGWDAVDVPGHDLRALIEALDPRSAVGRPRVVIAETIQGKGVSFMEDRFEWHYRSLTPELFERALAELGGEEGAS